MQELGSPCLGPAWQEYVSPLAICLVSIFMIFVTELVAFRWGTAKLAKLGLAAQTHMDMASADTPRTPHTAPRVSSQRRTRPR